MCLLDLLQWVREWEIVKTASTFFRDCFWEAQMRKKEVTIKKNKFFINNSLRSIKVWGDCDIISVIKVTQNGGQWKLLLHQWV